MLLGELPDVSPHCCETKLDSLHGRCFGFEMVSPYTRKRTDLLNFHGDIRTKE